jgi:hypothetical protein
MDRYIWMGVCKKVLLKNTLYFEQYKKEKFLEENGSKIVL